MTVAFNQSVCWPESSSPACLWVSLMSLCWLVSLFHHYRSTASPPLPSPPCTTTLPASLPLCLYYLGWTVAQIWWRTGKLRGFPLWGTICVSPYSPVSSPRGPSILWRWFSLCWWVTGCWRFLDVRCDAEWSQVVSLEEPVAWHLSFSSANMFCIATKSKLERSLDTDWESDVISECVLQTSPCMTWPCV